MSGHVRGSIILQARLTHGLGPEPQGGQVNKKLHQKFM
jgi:hypothetical protein